MGFGKLLQKLKAQRGLKEASFAKHVYFIGKSIVMHLHEGPD